MTSDAYTDDGGKTWRWQSNDAPCPLDACKAYLIPCDEAAQKLLISKHTDWVVAEYKRQQRMREQTAEEAFELRAAFGPGVKVINVLTGERKTT